MPAVVRPATLPGVSARWTGPQGDAILHGGYKLLEKPGKIAAPGQTVT